MESREYLIQELKGRVYFAFENFSKEFKKLSYLKAKEKIQNYHEEKFEKEFNEKINYKAFKDSLKDLVIMKEFNFNTNSSLEKIVNSLREKKELLPKINESKM